MRAMAKVTIQMGLLSIPEVSMFGAIESGEKVSFNQLHKECRNRLQQKMYCPECEHTIIDKDSEIIKGYPIGKTEWITMSKEEIESCKKESTDVLKIVQFVNHAEIPEVYYESASYLAPKKGGGAFSLLYALLNDTGKTALAKGVMRAKDHFYALRSYEQGVIVAYDLHFPNEIRNAGEVPKPKEKDDLFDDETYEMFGKLVEKMTRAFDPAIIKDEYTTALKNIIQLKAEGKVIPIEEVVHERKSINLKDALKESLKEAVNF